jgi:hypothetical protein
VIDEEKKWNVDVLISRTNLYELQMMMNSSNSKPNLSNN